MDKNVKSFLLAVVRFIGIAVLISTVLCFLVWLSFISGELVRIICGIALICFGSFILIYAGKKFPIDDGTFEPIFYSPIASVDDNKKLYKWTMGIVWIFLGTLLIFGILK